MEVMTRIFWDTVDRAHCSAFNIPLRAGDPTKSNAATGAGGPDTISICKVLFCGRPDAMWMWNECPWELMVGKRPAASGVIPLTTGLMGNLAIEQLLTKDEFRDAWWPWNTGWRYAEHILKDPFEIPVLSEFAIEFGRSRQMDRATEVVNSGWMRGKIMPSDARAMAMTTILVCS